MGSTCLRRTCRCITPITVHQCTCLWLDVLGAFPRFLFAQRPQILIQTLAMVPVGSDTSPITRRMASGTVKVDQKYAIVLAIGTHHTHTTHMHSSSTSHACTHTHFAWYPALHTPLSVLASQYNISSGPWSANSLPPQWLHAVSSSSTTCTQESAVVSSSSD